MSAAVSTRAPVFSVGVHILDVLGRPVGEIPPGQSSLLLEEIRATAAGTAAGTSVDLARLGHAVYSCGAIGDDTLGDMVEALLDREGVDTRYLVRKAGQRTSATILPIRPNGERPALHAPGAAQLLEPGDLDPSIFADGCRALHLGGPDAIGSFAGEPLAELARAARALGAIVTLDVLRPGDPETFSRLAPLLELCDWFMPNEEQLMRSTGARDLADAIAAAHAAGAWGVAVTRGADGCTVDWDGERLDLPALEVQVVDTTGCGDAFDAGFLTGLLLGAGPELAAWLGLTCGSLVATGLGSDAGIDSLDQVLTVLATSRPEAAGALSELASSAGLLTPS